MEGLYPFGDWENEEEKGIDENEVERIEEEMEDPTEEVCSPSAPKTRHDPQLPTRQQIAEHNVTHSPIRSWCASCVEARGKED